MAMLVVAGTTITRPGQVRLRKQISVTVATVWLLLTSLGKSGSRTRFAYKVRRRVVLLESENCSNAIRYHSKQNPGKLRL